MEYWISKSGKGVNHALYISMYPLKKIFTKISCQDLHLIENFLTLCPGIFFFHRNQVEFSTFDRGALNNF